MALLGIDNRPRVDILPEIRRDLPPRLEEFSEEVQWRKQGQLIEQMRSSGNAEPHCYFQGSFGSPVATMITLAQETGWTSIKDTPLRIYFPPSENLFNCSPRTPQVERRSRFREDAHEIDCWMLMGHGYGQTGAAFEPVARLAIEIARRDYGVRLGVATMSDMGAEGSVSHLGGGGSNFGNDIGSLNQADSAINTLGKMVGFDPVGKEWGEEKMRGIVGHSMWGRQAARYMATRSYREYPNIVTSVVTPVVMGVEPPGPIPAWVDQKIRSRYRNGMVDHVTLLTNRVSYLSRIGVRLGKDPGNDEVRAAILGNLEKYTRLISGVVTSYLGNKSYGHGVIVPIHVNEHIYNFEAVKLQTEWLRGMGYIAGDLTVGRERRGHGPMFQVGIANQDKTLDSYFMRKWTSELGLPVEGSMTYDHNQRVATFDSGHFPTYEMWKDLLSWQIRKIVETSNFRRR